MYLSYQILVLISLLTFSTFLVNAKNNILVAAKTIDENGNSKTKIEFNCCNYTKTHTTRVYTSTNEEKNTANGSPKGQKTETQSEPITSSVINITSEVKPTETLAQTSETKSEANDTLLDSKETDTEEKPQEMVVQFLRTLITSIKNNENKSECNENLINNRKFETEDKPNDKVVQVLGDDTVIKQTDESNLKGKETVVNNTTKEKPSETVVLILQNVTILNPIADTKSEDNQILNNTKSATQEKPSKLILQSSSILTSKQTGDKLEGNDTLLNDQNNKTDEQFDEPLGQISHLVSIVVGNATVSSSEDLGHPTTPIDTQSFPGKMIYTTGFPSVKSSTSIHNTSSDRSSYIPVPVIEQ
ncbi:uncharacterized protein [Diabrotica undecimpunctata]|uniref:uncharacterized protein n=1 Tax=Diabrotica undecimpunctata TaxID=50387 RepID=UPI003B63AB57